MTWQCCYCGRKGTRGFTETWPTMCTAMLACVKRSRAKDARALEATRRTIRDSPHV